MDIPAVLLAGVAFVASIWLMVEGAEKLTESFLQQTNSRRRRALAPTAFVKFLLGAVLLAAAAKALRHR